MAPVEARVESDCLDWAEPSVTSATTLPARSTMPTTSLMSRPRAAKLLRRAFLKRVAAGLASVPMREGKSRAKPIETIKPMGGSVVPGAAVGTVSTLRRRAEVDEAETVTSRVVMAWML